VEEGVVAFLYWVLIWNERAFQDFYPDNMLAKP
jgi:hypothetical protein